VRAGGGRGPLRPPPFPSRRLRRARGARRPRASGGVDSARRCPCRPSTAARSCAWRRAR
jgi:hypothetical protein